MASSVDGKGNVELEPAKRMNRTRKDVSNGGRASIPFKDLAFQAKESFMNRSVKAGKIAIAEDGGTQTVGRSSNKTADFLTIRAGGVKHSVAPVPPLLNVLGKCKDPWSYLYIEIRRAPLDDSRGELRHSILGALRIKFRLDEALLVLEPSMDSAGLDTLKRVTVHFTDPLRKPDVPPFEIRLNRFIVARRR